MKKYLNLCVNLFVVVVPIVSLPSCGNEDDSTSNNSSTDMVVSGTIEGHDYVNLGLSVKWATCNLGSTCPTEYGRFYRWGETTPYVDGSGEYYYGRSNFSKYNSTDGIEVLDKKDDAATAYWGNSWRMPTSDEMQELFDKCDWLWCTEVENGIKSTGFKFTSRVNGNSIFLPAAGCRIYDGSLRSVGIEGIYWSSSRKSYSEYAKILSFDSIPRGVDDGNRRHGFSVRPVTE